MHPARFRDLEVVLISTVCLELASRLIFLKWQLACAESCTGGLIAASCTDLSGSSQWFERGFVTYSNEAKCELLGVSPSLIAEHGAVSECVVKAMARGAIHRSLAQVSLAVTGIAGPTGGSHDKPVGTVWFGWCVNGIASAQMQVFTGNRARVRESASLFAVQGLLSRI